jgi:hypothetical protein
MKKNKSNKQRSKNKQRKTQKGGQKNDEKQKIIQQLQNGDSPTGVQTNIIEKINKKQGMHMHLVLQQYINKNRQLGNKIMLICGATAEQANKFIIPHAPVFFEHDIGLISYTNDIKVPTYLNYLTKSFDQYPMLFASDTFNHENLYRKFDLVVFDKGVLKYMPLTKNLINFYLQYLRDKNSVLVLDNVSGISEKFEITNAMANDDNELVQYNKNTVYLKKSIEINPIYGNRYQKIEEIKLFENPELFCDLLRQNLNAMGFTNFTVEIDNRYHVEKNGLPYIYLRKPR